MKLLYNIILETVIRYYCGHALNVSNCCEGNRWHICSQHFNACPYQNSTTNCCRRHARDTLHPYTWYSTPIPSCNTIYVGIYIKYIFPYTRVNNYFTCICWGILNLHWSTRNSINILNYNSFFLRTSLCIFNMCLIPDKINIV